MPKSAIHYIALHYNMYHACNVGSALYLDALLLSVALYCPSLHCTVLHCTALSCIAQYFHALHCIGLHRTVLSIIALYCPALHCTVLHCTVLPCIALYCIVLHSVCFTKISSIVTGVPTNPTKRHSALCYNYAYRYLGGKLHVAKVKNGGEYPPDGVGGIVRKAEPLDRLDHARVVLPLAGRVRTFLVLAGQVPGHNPQFAPGMLRIEYKTIYLFT